MGDMDLNVLIDTNVVLDALLERDMYYQSATTILALSENRIIRGYVSASAVTDIFYIIQKELKDKSAAIELIRTLLNTINVASVTDTNIYEALDLGWDDFEDSVQYVVGKTMEAEYIITRNLKDYVGSTVDVITPNDFLDIIML
jgi:predicted nucleic-acid-binding protein